MKVFVESTFGDMNFKGTNERGQSMQFSGNKEAVSPMESVLMAAAACSSIDVEMILKKDETGIQICTRGNRRYKSRRCARSLYKNSHAFYRQWEHKAGKGTKSGGHVFGTILFGIHYAGKSGRNHP